jgi:putative aldouronate transport system permease protein
MATITTPVKSTLEGVAKPGSLREAWRQIRRGWQLYLLLLLPVAWLLIFMYYPMYGAQIAFRDFLPGKSITGSEWIGLENFIRFFNSPMFMRLMKNTLWLSFYSLVVGFPIPIILALSLNQLQTGFFKRSVQMVSYAPYFISTVVMVGLLLNFLDMRRGPVNLLLIQLGLDPVQFMGSAELFPSVYVWSGVWQNTGFATIIYLAALTTVDPSLHEAAVVDGANRLQRMWHIDIPAITPVIVTVFILNMGQLLNVGFEKTYLMQNQLNLATSEVISTYVYKTGLAGGIANFSYAAAIGLFNSIIGLMLLVSANWAANRLTNKGLF